MQHLKRLHVHQKKGCVASQGEHLIGTNSDTDPATDEVHAALLVFLRGCREYQLYYRHSGEPRLVRAWGDDVPIDLLGGGFVVAPPSISLNGGSYQFIRGGLSDIRNVPPMRGVAIIPSINVSRRPG